MRRLLPAAAFAALALGVADPSAPLLAQAPKKDAPKTKEKEKEKKDAAVGTIELFEGKTGKYYLSFRDADGKYLGGGGPSGFDTKTDAEKALTKLRALMASGKVVERKGESPSEEKK